MLEVVVGFLKYFNGILLDYELTDVGPKFERLAMGWRGVDMRAQRQSDALDARLDEIDLGIVRLLQEDARSHFSHISKVLGVSAGTVRNRIDRMLSSGLLNFRVWLDPDRVGSAVRATLLVKVQPRQLTEVADALTEIDEVRYLATLAGAYDIVAAVVCRDVADLRRLIHERVQQIDGVLDVSTNLVTETKRPISPERG